MRRILLCTALAATLATAGCGDRSEEPASASTSRESADEAMQEVVAANPETDPSLPAAASVFMPHGASPTTMR
jgi:hypothetical protein